MKWGKKEPNGDGTVAYYNKMGVYDTDKTNNYHVVCVQKVACKYRLNYSVSQGYG